MGWLQQDATDADISVLRQTVRSRGGGAAAAAAALWWLMGTASQPASVLLPHMIKA